MRRGMYQKDQTISWLIVIFIRWYDSFSLGGGFNLGRFSPQMAGGLQGRVVFYVYLRRRQNVAIWQRIYAFFAVGQFAVWKNVSFG